MHMFSCVWADSNTSSMKHITQLIPCMMVSIARWKTAGADEIPNGNLA